jgi:hypothetical protein
VRIILLCLLGHAGCAKSVMPLYEAARADALRDAGPVPRVWEPDAVIHLSEEAISGLLTEVLHSEATLSGNVDWALGTLKPKLTVEAVSIGAAKKCNECVAVDAELGGTVTIKTSLLGKSSLSLNATVSFDAAFLVEDKQGTWTVSINPRRIRRATVDIMGLSAGLGDLDSPIRDWLNDSLVAAIPAQEVAELGTTELPLRAVRLVPGDGMAVELLTSSPDNAEAESERETPELGWRLDVASATLLALARAASFEQGVLGYDVVAEPTELLMVDDRFELGLRLWRIKGKGWWRDYTVRGAVLAKGRKLFLEPDDVEEGAKSAGALFADPLATLGEGVILRTIEDALTTSLPARHEGNLAGIQTELAVQGIDGVGHTLTLTGTLTMEPSPKPSGKGKR